MALGCRFRLGLILLMALAAPAVYGQTRVTFSQDIEPLIRERCLQCHGAGMQLSGLDLRTREGALKGGTKGPVLRPGDPEKSSLYRRVAGLEKPAMPMDGQLSEAEVQAIRRWIESGAHWEGELHDGGQSKDQLANREEAEIPAEARNFWAFQKPVRSPVPVTNHPDWNRHPVDAFLRSAMEARGLTPAPQADRRTLLRRAYLDLIGLPPTPEQALEFLNDRSPEAWERLIERLLASPHYGERWGRHWLDVARYADSNGYEHDFDRPNAWRYRDYVIRAFNRDTPYNVFLQEQIAGDELDWVTPDTLTATGFLRSYAKVGYREKDNPHYRYDYLDDMIATLGRGVMGLTVQCARCHNHKFDPIPQKDYYKLQASLFGYVEVDHPLVPPEEAQAYRERMAAVEARLMPLREEIRELEQPYRETLLRKKYEKFPQNVQVAIRTPEEQRSPGQVLLANQVIRTTGVSSAEIDAVLKPEDLARKRDLQERIQSTEKERPPAIPVAMGITDGDYRFTPDGPGDEPAPGKGIKQEAIEGSFLWDGSRPYTAPPSYFLHHGDINSRGSVMKPGFVTVAIEGDPPLELPPSHGRTSGRRRALAEWLTSLDHPLTVRVIVNRVWHHHFGRGIVASLDNFGEVGDRPTHPELLDWLAVEFTNRGWSIKQLHRLLMTSRAYQMSSHFSDPGNLRKDAANDYLWRFRAQRLEAEIVRDSILAVSGSLNAKIGGRPVFPPLPEDVLHTMKLGIWERHADGPEVWRRSVYVYRKRGLPFPFFEVFDLPDQNITCGRRNVSTVPTQALTLLNSEFVVTHSARLAQRLEEMAPGNLAGQIDMAYELALARPPEERERDAAREFLRGHSLQDFAHVLLNLNEFVYLR